MEVHLAAHHLGHVHLAGDGVAAGGGGKGDVLGADAHHHGLIARSPLGQALLGLVGQDDGGLAHLDLVLAVLLGQLAVKEVHLGGADEAGHEQIGGPVKDLLGGADLLDEAVLHDDDAVAQGHGLGLVVGDVDEGGVDALTQLDDLGAHLVAQLGVQVGQRLVHQEHLGVPDDGAADGHALALAAGQGLGLALQILGDVQDLGGLPHLLVDLLLGYLAQLQGKGHVLIHGHVGIQGVALEHHGDVPVLGLHVVHPLAADEQVALGDVLQAGDHPQGGGLAAAGGAYQYDELLVRDLQVEVVDGGHLVVIDLLYILQGYRCHMRGP